MADKEPCLIGAKIVVRGQVSGTQDLVIAGRIEGHIDLPHRVTVEKGAEVVADLDVAEANLRGLVKGQITASRLATLDASAQVVGTIRAPKVVIVDGARFSGTIEMDVDLPAELTEKGAEKPGSRGTARR